MLAATVIVLPWVPTIEAWLPNRLIAGVAVAGIFVVVESWLLIGDNPKERAKRLSFYMTSLYGGTTLGQLAIGVIGTHGAYPFMVVLGLLLLAVMPPLFVRGYQPESGSHQKLSLKKISRLSKPAIIGCMVSGMTMGTIYGLMPLSLKKDQFTTDQVGVLMASIILGGMLIQPVVSKLSVMMSKTLLLAMVSLLGVFAMGVIYISSDYLVMIVALALLGMSTFALYPVAITLACDNLDSSYIVAATQVMLFSYSIGSAMVLIAAGTFLNQQNGLVDFFFLVLLVTAIYMLIASLRRKASVLAN